MYGSYPLTLFQCAVEMMLLYRMVQILRKNFENPSAVSDNVGSRGVDPWSVCMLDRLLQRNALNYQEKTVQSEAQWQSNTDDPNRFSKVVFATMTILACTPTTV